MLVRKFFNNINQKNRSHYFSGLSFNSKNIKKNNIFFAIEGINVNGKKYIKEAIKKGANTIISNLNNLSKNALIVIHRNKKSRDLIPKNFKLIETRTYGVSKIIFLKLY